MVGGMIGNTKDVPGDMTYQSCFYLDLHLLQVILILFKDILRLLTQTDRKQWS